MGNSTARADAETPEAKRERIRKQSEKLMTVIRNADSESGLYPFSMVIRSGVDANFSEPVSGITPLIACVMADWGDLLLVNTDGEKARLYYEMLVYLLDSVIGVKADPNKTDDQGQTALMIAVAKSNFVALRVLLYKCGDPNKPRDEITKAQVQSAWDELFARENRLDANGRCLDIVDRRLNELDIPATSRRRCVSDIREPLRTPDLPKGQLSSQPQRLLGDGITPVTVGIGTAIVLLFGLIGYQIWKRATKPRRPKVDPEDPTGADLV